ncbi:4'-phosphopantetheinyl transferase [Candidatus Glomeribacter gigasporarum BEG34]|uniref:4'-phosphopantetheinyl transferase n=1 Tax=Candidatus Glomeribacter gigasporarum BEG34 TaxID=1070319 RepID=G2J7F6_9BURK|nr:4'-phosphopantetheinyl transferase [Candidatus Glomeribacter gigasporarum BEG34]
MSLNANAVYIWHVNLQNFSLHKDDHWHLLDNDEKAKANRFHFNIHRHRFIAARGILRCLAGQLLGQPPNALQFSYTSYGKPILKEYPRLQFNLSHSHDRAIYAFTLDMAIGVDIEYQNSQCDVESIAKRFFTAREFNALQTLPGPEKIATFFKLWVRKEAVLKALGYGLSWPLTKVEFNVEKQPICLSESNRDIKSSEWSLIALDPVRDFAAALALQAHTGRGQIHQMMLDSWP